MEDTRSLCKYLRRAVRYVRWRLRGDHHGLAWHMSKYERRSA